MISYVACDLFVSPAQVLVNTVNTDGVMGKGIAKDFKRIYPAMFTRYQDLCERGLLDIGTFLSPQDLQQMDYQLPHQTPLAPAFEARIRGSWTYAGLPPPITSMASHQHHFRC